MHNNDVRTREELRQAINEAIKNDNTEAYAQAFDEMVERIGLDVKADYAESIEEMKAQNDARVLASRGVRQLTNEEKTYYTNVIEAMKSGASFNQAIANKELALPETVIEDVLNKLRTEHPLLAKINFIPVNAKIKYLLNTNGRELATWGKLCDEIIKKLTAGLKEVDTGLNKLSAFLPVCKQMLTFGPEWLDRFVRDTLYEALANGLEAGIIDGDGDDKPIGMTRDTSPTASVVGGVYPRKNAIAVTNLDFQTVNNLVALLAVDPNGKPRNVNDLILVVNPADFYAKVNAAINVLAADGTYHNILPYPIDVIASPAVAIGTAVFGIASQYAAFAGASKEGIIEYSDHYHFLEDERVYLIKTFANGLPKDENSFLYLDISNLGAAEFKAVIVDGREPSSNAKLASLKLGSLTLSPTFDEDEDEYTATATTATNTITAIAQDAGAKLIIKYFEPDAVTGTIIGNGTSITWETGDNIVTVDVIAEDGTTTATYTVTVTKAAPES